MPKFIELSAEETISTEEIIGKALGMPLKNESKEDENSGCNKELCEHDAE